MIWIKYMPSAICFVLFTLVAVYIYYLQCICSIDKMISAGQYDLALLKTNKKLKSRFMRKETKFMFHTLKIKDLCFMGQNEAGKYQEALDLIKSTDQKYLNSNWRAFYLYHNLICEMNLHNTDEAKSLYEEIMHLPPKELGLFQNNLNVLKAKLYPDEGNGEKE